MGRSSKSGRKHDHDDEDVVDKRHRSDPVQGHNHSKHGDSTRNHHHHHRYDDEEPEASRNKSDRHEGRTKHDKKHRRDRSKRRQYNSGDDDSDMVKLKKERHRKHAHHRVDDHADSEKRKKQRRNDDDDDDDVKKKKSKKGKFVKETAALDTERKIPVDKSKLHSLGEPLGHPPDVVLDPERDYFAQNQRFRIYLYRECGLTFDELSSPDARNMFQDFVRQFNRGDLEAGYYASQVPMEALEQCPSTRHQWGLKITHQDSQNLQILQEGVRKQTEYQVAELHGSAATGMHKQGTSQGNVVLSANTQRPDQNTGETLMTDGLHHDRNSRVINRRLREHVQTTMDELTGGKKEGRERQIEKRQERAAKTHGASKYQQDMVELDDAALYGGNTNDDFHRLAAASRNRAAAQEAKKEERLLELQRKEEEKQHAMLQMLGLSHRIGQSKIEIQPRNDPPDDVAG